MKNVRVSRTNLVLRFAAGIYLLYSAGSLLVRTINGQFPDGVSLYSYIFSGLFAVFGVILLYTSARRYGAQQPEDVTGSVVWLLSDLSRFITGQLIPVNGGFVFN